MVELIKVPSHLYARLAKHAEGFDTPANVIERLLNAYEGAEANKVAEPFPRPLIDIAEAQSRKYEKYVFENREYGKGRLVLAVITAHVKSHPDISFGDLMATFPKRLQGSHGVFDTKDEAEGIFKRTGIKRHFINPNELIRLDNSVIAVSTQWGVGNIDNFILQAQSLGYVITVRSDTGQGAA